MTTGGISGAVLSKAVQPTTAQHLYPASCPQPGTVSPVPALERQDMAQRQIIPVLSTLRHLRQNSQPQ